MDIDDLKEKALVWQRRAPGGWCIVVHVDKGVAMGYRPHDASMRWNADEPILTLLHPTEGRIEDHAYNYCSAEDRLYIEQQSKLVGDVVMCTERE